MSLLKSVTSCLMFASSRLVARVHLRRHMLRSARPLQDIKVRFIEGDMQSHNIIRQQWTFRSNGRRTYCTPASTESYYVTLRGIPFTVNEQVIIDFLTGVKVEGGSLGVNILLKRSALPSGDAMVKVASAEDVRKAVALHRQRIGNRYIEIWESEERDLQAEIVSAQMTPFKSLTGHTVKITDVSDEATERDIMDIFHPLKPVAVEFRTGTGWNWTARKAFVDFATHDEALHAMKKRTQGDDSRSFVLLSYPGKCTCYPGDHPGPTNTSEVMVDDQTDIQHCLKLRGLPFKVTEQDIVDFLKGVKVERGSSGIYLMLKESGGRNGLAYLKVATEEDVKTAVALSGQFIGSRYVELQECHADDMCQYLQSCRLMPFRSKTGHTIEINDVPIDTTDEDIKEFFDPLKPVAIEYRARRWGMMVFVDFSTHEEALEAMQKQDLQMRGRRKRLHILSYPGETTCYPGR